MTPPPAAADARGSRPRAAILQFLVEGEGQSPAMAMQLRDGFLIGLVREGIDVIDSTDVTKQLARAPELQGCETSPCLKRLGELLSARFVLRVKISVTGNSYRMAFRLFSTEGAAPAAMPLANQSRACDVCTVNEAREHMIRLAEGVRSRIEDYSAPLLPAKPPPRRSRTPGFLTVAAGLAAIVGGALLVASSPDTGKRRPAFGGAMMGLGLGSSLVGLYATFDESKALAFLRDRPPGL
jgi:hypothetical protein